MNVLPSTCSGLVSVPPCAPIVKQESRGGIGGGGGRRATEEGGCAVSASPARMHEAGDTRTGRGRARPRWALECGRRETGVGRAAVAAVRPAARGGDATPALVGPAGSSGGREAGLGAGAAPIPGTNGDGRGSTGTPLDPGATVRPRPRGAGSGTGWDQ